MTASPRSKALFARAVKSLVGGVNSPVRAFKAVGGDPLFFAGGKGAWLRDVDGRRYMDFCLSWGPLILGHARAEVVAAATRALKSGSTFGAPCEGEVLLAEEVRRALPSMELVRFTSSGTEAVMGALRAARAFTGRDRTVKFSGCYHGHADPMLVAAGSGAATLGHPDSAGVPAAWAADTIVLPFNDPAAVDRAFAAHGSTIAALIVEPIVGNMGVVAPEPGFLEHLRAVTRRNGSVLVFDEVITGFRVGLGGAQGLYGVRPDLTTLGKIVGGGLPVGCYGGRREIMEVVAPLGPAYQAGTLSGNPVAMAAGLATLKLLRSEKPYARLASAAKRVAAGLRSAAKEAGIPVSVNSAPGMFTVFFKEGEVRDWETANGADRARYGKFFHALLDRGIYFPPAQFEAALLSSCHDDRLLDRFLTAARAAFHAV